MIVTRVVGTERQADGQLMLEVARLDVDRRSVEAPRVLGKKRITVQAGASPSTIFLAVRQAGIDIQAALSPADELVREYINERLEDAGI